MEKIFTSAAINLDVDHRASNKLAKSCNYLVKTLFIRNSKKGKRKD